MKSKTPLTLTELLIMLLVFALAAALCLQVFAGAGRISEESARLDAAVTHAQSMAEVLKSCGDYRQAAARLGGSWDGHRWVIPHEDYSLLATPVEGEYPLLERAEVTALDPAGEVIFSIPVTWQKGGALHG